VASFTQTYPAGVPPRRARPRSGAGGEFTIAGAIVGLLLSERLEGGLLGGVLGHAIDPKRGVALSLETSVRNHLTSQGALLVELYRHGPYRVEILFAYAGQYWTIESTAPPASDWTQENLDDWLFGDLMDHQLPSRLRAFVGGPDS